MKRCSSLPVKNSSWPRLRMFAVRLARLEIDARVCTSNGISFLLRSSQSRKYRTSSVVDDRLRSFFLSLSINTNDWNKSAIDANAPVPIDQPFCRVHRMNERRFLLLVLIQLILFTEQSLLTWSETDAVWNGTSLSQSRKEHWNPSQYEFHCPTLLLLWLNVLMIEEIYSIESSVTISAYRWHSSQSEHKRWPSIILESKHLVSI